MAEEVIAIPMTSIEQSGMESLLRAWADHKLHDALLREGIRLYLDGPDRSRVDRREQAFRVGWRINAIQASDETPETYLKACEDADWAAYRSGRMDLLKGDGYVET